MAPDFETIINHQLSIRYDTPRELKYAIDPGFLLSPHDYESYLGFVESQLGAHPRFVSLPLKAFGSGHIYYALCGDLQEDLNELMGLLQEDLQANQSLLSNRDPFDVAKSRIYSEIEGSVNIESVPTTRRRLKELLEDGAPSASRNDTIVKNMDRGIRFVNSKPPFNKENLAKLYRLLSEGCLDPQNELKSGDYYRYDGVGVDGFPGCTAEKIEESMDSLFAFVESTLSENDFVPRFFLPHICHYYLLYIHPYFDYNGRTARMVSYWLYLLLGFDLVPPLLSEAINQTKNDYYAAIRNARIAHNDLTYFLKYILQTAIRYYLCYKDLESINTQGKKNGIPLTDTDIHYVKCLLIGYKGAFDFRDFLSLCRIAISKQGALQILNRFVNAGILVEAPTKGKTKLFDLNRKVIRYMTVR